MEWHRARGRSSLLVMACILMAGCQPTSDSHPESAGSRRLAAPQPAAAVDQPTQPQGGAGPAAMGPRTPLALRSIRITLETKRPDGTARTLVAEIDKAGRCRIQQTPVEAGGTAAPGEQARSGAADVPQADDPSALQQLRADLQGSDAPGLWLWILPEGSLVSQGIEQVGGFAAEKFAVRGSVDEQTITGVVWIEPASRTVVRASLNVPGALVGQPDRAATGVLSINLTIEKSDAR
jgi:hypothetical protein